VIFLTFVFSSVGVGAQNAATKVQPKAASPVQPVPKRTVFNKDFAKLLIQAVEAVGSSDGSSAADQRVDAAKAAALAEAEMEQDKAVRENEKTSITFGFLLVKMLHGTYEISGKYEDLKKYDACADDYKDAIRKAVVTEQVGDNTVAVIGHCK
jgi:hypothetical protein